MARLDAIIQKWIRDEKMEELLADMQNENSRLLPDERGDGNNNTASDRRGGADRRKSPDKKIAWLDVQKGVERFGGDRETFMQILRSFAKSTSSLLDAVRKASEDNLADYAITVHGIKGSSRGICAEIVGDMAETLEKAAKSGNYEFVNTRNPDFIKSVEALIKQINDMFDKMIGENEKPRKNTPDIETLSALLAACKNYDMDGVDAAMAEIENFEYEAGGELAAWLRTNVDQMNFKEIEEKLSGLTVQ